MNPAALFAGGLAAGLAAGTASCAAVQGGLLIGLVSPRGSPHGPSRGLPPVAAFLTGRLAAHTALGALLGLAGAVVQIGPRTRAALLVAAGTAVVVLAVRMLRRRGAGCAPAGPGPARPSRGRGCSPPDSEPVHSEHGHNGHEHNGHGHSEHGCDCAPPRSAPGRTASATRETASPGTAAAETVTRGGTRSPTLVRAAALGMATIFVPCGVTIGMEVVAVGAGSALGGAAALAGLALGTAPAFAALGLLLRTLASTRLAALAGIAALAAGLFTVGSGLRLGGWLPDFSLPQFGSPAAAAGRALTGTDGVQRLTVWATAEGFRPGIAVAAADRPVELVFRTKDNRSCTRTLAIDDHDVVLPVTGERVVRLAARPEGRLRYACGMGMYVGFVRFERIP
ncbi:sulfite exporter TauE/SafE family protein [Microbispora sp. NEAU-D428]|uniref:urease accessory protein UreH domain-containing protein n=1 Tax=Microbispora sitophila TaxID=2771537 RepID=UPI001867E94A|nr:sulfite exporter TauE/SafE family protein [Microbispora sitophila]MBE3015611.1 sulfite exporter TauE/SafE family protein [Microbispora sitophila]